MKPETPPMTPRSPLDPRPTIFKNDDELAQLSASQRIRYRLVSADCRYHANDNISAFSSSSSPSLMKAEMLSLAW